MGREGGVLFVIKGMEGLALVTATVHAITTAISATATSLATAEATTAEATTTEAAAALATSTHALEAAEATLATTESALTATTLASTHSAHALESTEAATTHAAGVKSAEALECAGLRRSGIVLWSGCCATARTGCPSLGTEHSRKRRLNSCGIDIPTDR